MSAMQRVKTWPDWLKCLTGLLTAIVLGFIYYVAPAPGMAKGNAKTISELKTAQKELNAKCDANKDSVAKISPEISEIKTDIKWIRKALERIEKE